MFSHNNLALRNVKCDWCISFIQVATNRTHPIFENSAYFYIKLIWIHLLDIFKLVEYKSINARSALLVVVTVFLKEGQIYQNISKNHANSWGWQNVCCQTQLFCLLKKRQNSYKSNHPEVFQRKAVLKICGKFTGGHPCQRATSIMSLCNFIEITLRYGCSPVNLLHIEITLRHENKPASLQKSIQWMWAIGMLIIRQNLSKSEYIDLLGVLRCSGLSHLFWKKQLIQRG